MTNRRRWTQQAWILLGAVDIATERKQAEEEGRDLSSVEAEFDAVQQLELNSEADWQRAEALLDAVQELPLVDGYAYEEPSDLKGIKAARPRAGMPAPRLPRAERGTTRPPERHHNPGDSSPRIASRASRIWALHLQVNR